MEARQQTLWAFSIFSIIKSTILISALLLLSFFFCILNRDDSCKRRLKRIRVNEAEKQQFEFPIILQKGIMKKLYILKFTLSIIVIVIFLIVLSSPTISHHQNIPWAVSRCVFIPFLFQLISSFCLIIYLYLIVICLRHQVSY